MQKRWYIDFQTPFSIPCVLLAFYIGLDVLTFAAGMRMYFPAAAQTVSPAGTKGERTLEPAELANLSRRLTAMEQKLNALPQAEALENRADLQKLLAALVTVGTIFGLA